MIELGNEVECRITGFRGTVTGRCEYINGYVQFLIKPKMKKGKEEKYPDGNWIDREHLRFIGKGILLNAEQKERGGESESPMDR